MGLLSSNHMNLHCRFNPRNQRMVKSAEVVGTVPTKYKTAFITLCVETYMAANPLGINMDDVIAVQKETDRSFQPKTSIQDNLKNAPARPPAPAAVPRPPEARPVAPAAAPPPTNETITLPRPGPQEEDGSDKVNAGFSAFDIKIE